MAQARSYPRLAITLPAELEQAMRRLAERDFGGVLSRAIAYALAESPVTKSALAGAEEVRSTKLT